MGENADMMLDGILCEGCGVYIDDEDGGYPRLCGSCAQDRKQAGHEVEKIGSAWVDCGEKEVSKIQCSQCGKWVHPSGFTQHNEAKHNEND